MSAYTNASRTHTPHTHTHTKAHIAARIKATRRPDRSTKVKRKKQDRREQDYGFEIEINPSTIWEGI